jgi:hypothetical protein
MENRIQQEILLMTGSSLSKRNLCENDNSGNSRLLSTIEQLENACWNGMLEEFLPGLILTIKGKTLLLWEIQNANNFLHIDLCDQPQFLNKEHSVDPYFFLSYLNCN